MAMREMVDALMTERELEIAKFCLEREASETPRAERDLLFRRRPRPAVSWRGLLLQFGQDSA